MSETTPREEDKRLDEICGRYELINGRSEWVVNKSLKAMVRREINTEVHAVLDELLQYNGAYIGMDGKRVEKMVHHDIITQLKQRYGGKE